MKRLDEKKIAIQLLIGAGALVSLLLMLGPFDFSNYFIDEIIWLFISSFFVVPLVKTAVNRKYDHDDTLPLILGFTGSWIYTLANSWFISDWLILFLESIIVISILSVIFALLKEELRVE